LNNLQEEDESLFESKTSNSPLTLEKAKKERDQQKGFIRNPAFKRPESETKRLKSGRNESSWNMLRRKKNSILKKGKGLSRRGSKFGSRRGSKVSRKSITGKSIRSIYQEERS
jgi:hypothetical protein